MSKIAIGNISELKLNDELTVSVKYHGTLIVINNGTYTKSKNRPITKIDYLLGDNYFYPVIKVFDRMLDRTDYGRFTCCSDRSIHQDSGCYDMPEIHDNFEKRVVIDDSFMAAMSSGFIDVCAYLGITPTNIDKIIMRHDISDYIISSGNVVHYTQDTFGHMITVDILNNISTGTINNLLPQANYDDLLIKISTELFIEYVNNTKYTITDVFSDMPDFLKNSFIEEKLAMVDDYRLTEMVNNNPAYYDVFCFIMSLLRRKILNKNRFIKPLHIRKFSNIISQINSLHVPYSM